MINPAWKLVDKRFFGGDHNWPGQKRLDSAGPGTDITIRVKSIDGLSETILCKVQYVDVARLFYEVLIVDNPKLTAYHYLKAGDHLQVLRSQITTVI